VTATGTIYALVDPRDGEARYIGKTTKTMAQRLNGHLRSPAGKVRPWIAELRAIGLEPGITAVRQGVPVAELRAAEHEEITRVIAAGGTLLNDQATALGRELNYQRREAERVAAERAGWAELATAAIAVLGGPVPPGDLPLAEIPDVSWRFMSTVQPDRREYVKSLLDLSHPRETSGERYARWRALSREEEEAGDQLWWQTGCAWGHVRGIGDDSFSGWMERNFRIALGTRFTSRKDASRFLGLAVWYMVAVNPWRHLAELGGLPLDDVSFTGWAGKDARVREALLFLAGRGEGMLEKLSAWRDEPRREMAPGRLLGAVAAAYSGTAPEAIRSDLVQVLEGLADDHTLTRPMADLLMRLNPRALDSTFGLDIAAELDRDLGLQAGTSGRVLRALMDRLGPSNDPAVRRAADRSAQQLPVVALPDYKDWSGPSVLSMRSVSGSLVRAGVAEPDDMTTDEYLAYVRALWTPRLAQQREQAA
jgi:hypothetical protein